MTTRNLIAEAIEVANADHNPRLQHWARLVDEVDMTIKTGHAFKGEWIERGEIEVPIGSARIILLCTSPMEDGHAVRHYFIIKMRADGSLENTGITGGGKKWALDMRQVVVEYLESIAGEMADPLPHVPYDDLCRSLAFRNAKSLGDTMSTEVWLDGMVSYALTKGYVVTFRPVQEEEL